MTEIGDIEAFEVIGEERRGPAVVLCEHASNHVPDGLGGLGLGPAELRSHIAWDPGAGDVAAQLGRLLDAPVVAGRISRLVYDCNRPPEAEDAIPERSEFTDIPGNRGLDAGTRARRARLIYHPFHAAVDRVIDARAEPPILVTVHSFTPVYLGKRRDVQVGVLHDADARLADAMLETAARHTALRVDRNQPYGPQDGVTHSLARHALPRGLLNVMIEIRNDLLADEAACTQQAAMLHGWIEEAVAAIRPVPAGLTRSAVAAGDSGGGQ